MATSRQETPPRALDVRGVVAGYGAMVVLDGVSLSVEQGSLVAIIGPNGAGKSTVLKSILNLLHVMSGSIHHRGEAIVGGRTHEIIKSGVGYVPQGRIVFPFMTVSENLDMGAYTSREESRRRANAERTFDLFPELYPHRKRLAGELSGGQQQMLAIGRAVMSDPDTVLMDEPSLGLAPKYIDTVFQAMVDMRDEGYSLLVVEQNATRALEVAEYAYVLETGLNRFEGTGSELLNDTRVKRLYLGG